MHRQSNFTGRILVEASFAVQIFRSKNLAPSRLLSNSARRILPSSLLDWCDG